ncbi:hypothetical protein V6R21_10100 [Limibacter armeniacum]|uniref:hypothetical protein n=1 Tax=Limibacter armeniacum TaxID=466084 RepID=UPI002FE6BC90
MYNILKESHSGIGMVLLFLLLTVIIFLLAMFLFKKTWNKSAKIAALVGLILVHLQLLVGLLIYFMSPLGWANFSSESMGYPISRFYIVEHPFGMLLAAFLITKGYKFSKSNTLSSRGKYKRLLVFYSLGFGVITYLIPWFLWS